MNQFQLWKKQALQKNDKSFIGRIDSKILSLCNTINSKESLFTLSSCSGRIALQLETFGKKVEKIWEFVSHDEVEINNLIKKIQDSKKELIFIQESAILHICTENLDLARTIMHIGKESGFNQVGIIACKTKIVVELICDSRLEIPLYNLKIELNEEYLDLLLQKANTNLHKSWKAINTLEEKINDIQNT